MRSAYVERKTKETDIKLKLNLDGGDIKIDTGIGFFDHMLNSFATHGRFGLEVSVKGDLYVDEHHTVEDSYSSRQRIRRGSFRQRVNIEKWHI